MTIQRILIWSGWLRLAHWLIALSTLGLLLTGWLLSAIPSLEIAASDFHYMLAPFFSLGVGIRITLLFIDKKNAGLGSLTPEIRLQPMATMLRFYLSLGRLPLPRWYAHNPLWAPVYLAILFLLILQAASGYLQVSMPMIAGIYVPGLHRLIAMIVALFTIAHIVTVILHDLKGTASDISAMINGYKIFVVERKDDTTIDTTPSVSIDSIKKTDN